MPTKPKYLTLINTLACSATCLITNKVQAIGACIYPSNSRLKALLAKIGTELKRLLVKTLAYYDLELITTVKSFIAEVVGIR